MRVVDPIMVNTGPGGDVGAAGINLAPVARKHHGAEEVVVTDL